MLFIERVNWQSLFNYILGTILAIVLLLIPLLFYSYNTHTIVIKETLWQCSTVLFILLLPLVWFLNRNPSNQTTLVWPYIFLGLLTFFLFLSYQFLSPYPQSKDEMLQWFTYILFTFAIWQWCKIKLFWQIFLYTTIFASFLVCVYAIFQAAGIDFFEWGQFGFGDETRRVTSSMGNPDFLAGYLIGLLPITLILFIISKKIQRWLYLFVLVSYGFALLFSYSRGGWLAALITMILLLSMLIYINWFRKPLLIQPIISPKHALFGVVFFGTIGLISAFFFRNEIGAAYFRLTQFLQGDSVSNRIYFYTASVKMWLASPLIGFGIGSFNRVFPEFRDVELSKTMPFKDWNLDHAHNEFLEIATEMGLLGLLIYISFIGLILFNLWKALLINRSRNNLLIIGFICSIFAIWIHNLFTVTLRHTPSAYIFWGMIGLSLAWLENLNPATKSAQLKSKIKYLAFIIALFISPYLLNYSINHFRGDLYIANAFRQIETINKTSSVSQFHDVMEDVLIKLNKGKRLAPDSFQAHFRLGLAYDLCKDYIQQQKVYKEIFEYHPHFTSLAMNLFVANLNQSDQIADLKNVYGQPFFHELSQEKIKDAIHWIKLAIEQDPYAPEYYRMLGRSYVALNKIELAREAYQKTLDTAQYRYPNQIQEEINEAKYYLDLLPSE